ncbi:MAG TPA: septum formation protein Maf [Gammaproteobacteria bacterium]|nr:septum formation protein Maf [Gammaproteobacteria bacterium]
MLPMIILASGSSSRRTLLERLRLPFEVIPADVDETPLPSEAAAELASRLSFLKAEVVAARYPGAVVIGSDQVGECRGTRLSKPGTAQRAEEQLHLIQGSTVDFYSGVTVIDGRTRRTWTAVGHCELRLRPLDREQIRRYVALDRPLASAGAFLAESLGSCLFEWARADDPTTLLGMPLIRLCAFLREAGIDPLTRDVRN